MIRKLKGILDTKDEGYVIIDVAGVGYHVFCSNQTLSNLPGQGEAIALWIETHVREDHIHLFGFLDEAELRSFQLLNTVTGVGAKMAIAILSGLNAVQLSQAIAAEDKAAFKPISGVGPKLAARIINDLKDKLGTGFEMPSFINPTNVATATPAANDDVMDAVSALTNLGYGRSDAYAVINKVVAKSQDALPINELIRQGLKELTQA